VKLKDGHTLVYRLGRVRREKDDGDRWKGREGGSSGENEESEAVG
jgi:hypothetical protein